MIVMYDTVTVETVPPDPPAVAGYVGGSWPTYNGLVAKFPHARHLSIAVNAGEDADCLDVEPGDAVADQAPAWTRRQLQRNPHRRPVLYTSAGNAQHLIAVMEQAGLHRSEWVLWSAHYVYHPHICGAATCGYPQADGTQWTDRALNRNLDESLCSDEFFPLPPPVPDPHHYDWFDRRPRPELGGWIEVAVVREYDRLRIRPFIHRPRLAKLRDACSMFAGRIATVATEQNDWSGSHRYWRREQLLARAHGDRLA